MSLRSVTPAVIAEVFNNNLSNVATNLDQNILHSNISIVSSIVWRYLNCRMFGVIRNYNGCSVSDTSVISHVYNNYFSNVATNLDHNIRHSNISIESRRSTWGKCIFLPPPPMWWRNCLTNSLAEEQIHWPHYYSCIIFIKL